MTCRLDRTKDTACVYCLYVLWCVYSLIKALMSSGTLIFLMLTFCVTYFWDECNRESKHHISPCEKCQQVFNTHLCQAVQRQKNPPKHILRGATENFMSLERKNCLSAPMVLPVQMLEGLPVWCRTVCPSFAARVCASNSKHLKATQATVLAGYPDICNNTLCPQVFNGELCLIFRSTCKFNCYKADFYRSFMNIFYIWDLPCRFAFISDNKLHSCCVGHSQMSPQCSRVTTWCTDWLGWFQSQGEKKRKSWYKAQLIINWRAKI